MKRRCDGTDKFLQDAHRQPCSCGLEFDDLSRSTIYPHQLIVAFPATDDPEQARRAEGYLMRTVTLLNGSPDREPFLTGAVISYTEEPSVTIVAADGTHMSWLARLIKEATPDETARFWEQLSRRKGHMADVGRGFIEVAERLDVAEREAAQDKGQALDVAGIADAAIGLFLEYQNMHCRDEVDARQCAVRDVVEGAEVDVAELNREAAQTPDEASVPGFEGSIGPGPGQYSRPHVYARDIRSGAGNCVCGGALGDRLHTEAAPGVPVPAWAVQR